MPAEIRAFPPPGPIVVADALLASVHWLSAFELSQAQIEQFQQLADAARAAGVSYQEAAENIGLRLTAPLLLPTLWQMAASWYSGGSNQLALTRDHLLLGHFDIDEEHRLEDRAMACLIRFLAELGDCESISDCSEWTVRGMFGELQALGNAFEAMGQYENAARCFDVGCNIVARVGEPEFAQAAGKARKYVRRISDAQLSAGILVKHATALIAAAQTDARLELDAYDALYDALLALQGQTLLREQTGEFIRQCLSDRRYRSLAPLYLLSDPNFDRSQLPESHRNIRLVPPVSDAELSEWPSELHVVRELFLEAERGRLALEPKPSDTTVAEADWTTWAVSHPAYYRAIPDGGSFLRATDNANLLLVLCHEMTHVFTMNGYIGLAILALKAAAVSLVVELYRKADLAAGGLDFLRALPNLGDHTLVRLGTVERALHVIRKLQILKAVWSPWFEGIAVLTELADPAEDTEAYGPALEVMQNLVDQSFGDEKATRESMEAALRQFAAEMEKRYSNAVADTADIRLHQYLVARHDGYLVGYLAARAIMASWRQTLQEPLPAAIAARLLLHLTRVSTADSVPDLSLPLEEFAQQAAGLHIAWLRSLTALCAESLRSAQRPYTSASGFRSMRWKNGEVEWLDAEQTEAHHRDAGRFAVDRAKQAWLTLLGVRTDLPETSGQDRSAECMEALAEAFSKKEPDETRATSAFASRTIISSVRCE